MHEDDLDLDPIRQFGVWLEDAQAACAQAEAMPLATSPPDGRPSARMVLLRGHDERGFVFFTNAGSRKGRELRANPWAALVFHWWELGRQVRVEGRVDVVSPSESAAYWETRPRESRIAAWASPQSEPLGDRAELDGRVAKTESRFADDAVPLPPFWGGF